MIESIDHVVLTSRSIKKTIFFYVNILGMSLEKNYLNNKKQFCLKFGKNKINLHTENNPFSPHAYSALPGTLDLCLLSKYPLNEWISRLNTNGIAIELGPVKRQGAEGPINSIYIRDPDGNLIEIANNFFYDPNL